jgi:hypothetical protein
MIAVYWRIFQNPEIQNAELLIVKAAGTFIYHSVGCMQCIYGVMIYVAVYLYLQ